MSTPFNHLRAEVDLQATLPNPPSTLPAWAKVLWYITGTVAQGVIWQQFDYGAEIPPLPLLETDPDATTWRHIQVLYADSVSGEAADDQIFTIDVANFTNGTIDNTWTAGDYTAVDTAINGFCQAQKSHISARLTSVGYRSYIRAFNPLSDPKPFAPSGPPEHVSTWSILSTGVDLPPQVSCSVTEITPSPNNWGRFYTPTLSHLDFQTSGRYQGAAVNSWATATESMFTTLSTGNQLIPVVPTTSVAKRPVRALQAVTGIRVDDVTDVIRRRRFKSKQYSMTEPGAIVFGDPG